MKNDDPKKFIFVEYESDKARYDSILYPLTRPLKHKDVRENVQFIDLSLLENIATGKLGRISE